MILQTTIRPDRFKRIVSGEKKEHRIPVRHIELGEKEYDVVKFCSAFGVWVLVDLLRIEEDRQAGEYVLFLGDTQSASEDETKINTDNQYHLQGKTEKKYIQKCEILRDGQKVGILNLSTKQGSGQRKQLGRLQGYTFKNLPLEIITC